MSAGSEELSPELLDDFYAECDEQLSNMRTQVAALEHARATGEQNATAAESLFRSVHSFKGNAAIVGLAAAEQLAHAAETLLRRITRHELAVDHASLELIGDVCQRLDAMVAAFRRRESLPASTDLLERLGAGVDVDPGRAPEKPEAPRPAAPATPSAPDGPPAWRATFAPSTELDARGVSVGVIRERLSALGPIRSAAPRIAAGRVSFTFAVALRDAPPDVEAWLNDGVTWEPPAAAEPAPAVAAAPGAGAPAGPVASPPSQIVRVDLSRLDDLMRIAGEMVIHRSRLQDRIGATGDTALQEVNVALTRSIRELRKAIMRVRLVPIREVFSRLPYVVRDLERDSGKQVRLVLEGEDTEIDKFLVERLKEPLLHLVRNAVSHGIETPAERAQAGKPAEATLLLQAAAAGDTVTLVIRDDGRGIDAARVVSRARETGAEVPDVVDAPELLRLICAPGFSTREAADRAAGRGIGMAVVDTTVRELGGTLSLATSPGEFTAFTIRLPLTLAITDAVIVKAGRQVCAVPQMYIREITQTDASDIRLVNHTEVSPYRGGLLPLVRLSGFFHSSEEAPPTLTLLIIDSDRGPTGLVVDGIVGRREIVVRSLTDTLVRVPGVAAATELGDGRPVLILDAPAVVQSLARVRGDVEVNIPADLP